MKAEEAINWLQRGLFVPKNILKTKEIGLISDAYDMAVKAIRAQSENNRQMKSGRMKMIRPIDADALVKWMTSATGFRANCEDCTDIDCINCIVEEAIKNSPTIDPVKHGRWILEMVGQDHNYRGYHCSECGYRLAINPKYIPNYCEHCGARMENGHMKAQEW